MNISDEHEHGGLEPRRLGHVLKIINDEIMKRGNNQFREHGITMSQANVLIRLHRSGGHRARYKDIEKSFHVSQATMAGVISRLEEKGMVRTFADSEDRRAKNVELTRRGLDICDKARSGIEMLEEIMVEGMDESEREQLLKLLDRVRLNITGEGR